mmetsp:Transcript_13818/g.12250  ORF Transcript_13818/g.12250 Transcript_13818/m.12250 type:complete len:111 (+) Transcript_13818:302-634(+)
MLSENIQIIWAFIIANSQKNLDILAEAEGEFFDTVENKLNPNMIVSKQADDYYFSSDSFVTKGVEGIAKSQYVSMDSSLSLVDNNNEDKFIIEQTKMIETLMNIVEFIFK